MVQMASVIGDTYLRTKVHGNPTTIGIELAAEVEMPSIIYYALKIF